MKTKCYCFWCKKHPLHSEKDKITSRESGEVVGFNNYPHINSQLGRDVNCLEPISNAFDELSIDPKDFDWNYTSYGDGSSYTEVDGGSFQISAICKNEEHEE